MKLKTIASDISRKNMGGMRKKKWDGGYFVLKKRRKINIMIFIVFISLHVE
jgi:hypothetical protein